MPKKANLQALLQDPAVQAYLKLKGHNGGKKRAANLSKERRSEIASIAGKARAQQRRQEASAA
jgi:hypothetical protein